MLTQTGKIFANFDNSIKSGILGELAREEEEAEKKQQDSSAPAQGNPVRRGSDGFLDADVTGDIPQQPESEDDFDVAYVTDRRQGARSQKPATVPHRSGIYEAGADPATAEEGVYAPRTGAKDDEDHDAGNTPYTEDADAERPAEYPDEAYAESPASTLVKHIQSRRADSRTKRMRRMALNMRKNLPGIPKIQEWIPRKCV